MTNKDQAEAVGQKYAYNKIQDLLVAMEKREISVDAAAKAAGLNVRQTKRRLDNDDLTLKEYAALFAVVHNV